MLKNTKIYFFYGDPVSLDIKDRMIRFWERFINGKPDKISSKLYNILLSMHNRDLYHSIW